MSRSAMPRCVRLALALLVVGAVPAVSRAQPVGASTPVARLRGTVFDSIAGAPLANAAVRVFRSDSGAIGIDTRTDATGTFQVPSLTAGTWLLSFLHPRLDSLRLEPPLARVDVVEAGVVHVPLAIPSAATLARALCGSTRDDSSAVLVGDVREAAGRRPLVDATVRATWPEWVFAKKQMAREEAVRTARTDSSGQFVLCNVPQGTTVTAMAYRGADSTGVVEVAVPNGDYAVTDFLIDRQSELASVGVGPTRIPWRRGAGMVIGRVQTPDGRPFVNAIARVIGSGSPVRSDSNGMFRVVDAAAGTQTVEVRAVGFDPKRRSVQLSPGESTPLSITVERSRVSLDTVRVIAGRRLPPDVERIETRWRRGLGTILDGATVRERTSTYLTSALWSIPGVRLGMRQGFGNTIYLRAGGGGECIPVIFLDGFRFISSGISIDEMVSPDEVAAIEMYVRAMQRPAEYTDLSDCGVFVVWTKRFLGNVPVLDPRRRQ